MMAILELIWENIVDIVVGIFLIKNTTKLSAKKQANFEEKTEESKIEAKRKRLEFLRNKDKEYEEGLKNNLQEEAKLEKELGENGQKA